MKLFSCLAVLAVVAASLLGSPHAQAVEIPDTPASPKAWINSEPIDLHKLKGKVFALVFYEEL